MHERGNYGKPRVGADVYVQRGSSFGTWIVGGLLVGGAVLWAKYQSDQIGKLSSAAGLPHHSFAEDLRDRVKGLSETARVTIHKLTAKKEA